MPKSLIHNPKLNYTCIPPYLSQTFEMNFPPLLSKICASLGTWHHGLHSLHYTTSWFWRCNIIKIGMLPKFLYLFQVLPIAIPSIISNKSIIYSPILYGHINAPEFISAYCPRPNNTLSSPFRIFYSIAILPNPGY